MLFKPNRIQKLIFFRFKNYIQHFTNDYKLLLIKLPNFNGNVTFNAKHI